jgi:hypothetical protein
MMVAVYFSARLTSYLCRRVATAEYAFDEQLSRRYATRSLFHLRFAVPEGTAKIQLPLRGKENCQIYLTYQLNTYALLVTFP